jgi:hypothetical protein
MKAMLPEPLIVKVGRHTPQHCSVLSRRKRRRATQDNSFAPVERGRFWVPALQASRLRKRVGSSAPGGRSATQINRALVARPSHFGLKCSFCSLREDEGMQLALAEHAGDLPEGEEGGQGDGEDDCDKNNAAGTSAADAGDALVLGMLWPIVSPLNTPTAASSTTSKTKNKIENATALHKIG